MCRSIHSKAERLAAEAAELCRICGADSHVSSSEVAVVESGSAVLAQVQRIRAACKLMISQSRCVLATELHSAEFARIRGIAELFMRFVYKGRSELCAAMLALWRADGDD
jgi:hypothetical protein